MDSQIVSIDAFCNVLNSWKARVVFNQLANNSLQGVNRKLIKKCNRQLLQYLFTNQNIYLNSTQKNQIKDINKDQNQLKFDISNFSEDQINQEDFKQSKFDVLYNIKINQIFTKKTQNIIFAFDRLQEYSQWLQFQEQGIFMTELLFRQKIQENKSLFLHKLQNICKQKKLEQGFQKNCSILQQIFDKNELTCSLELIKKFFIAAKISNQIYGEEVYDYETTCVKVLNDYTKNARLLYSIVKSNVNYIKHLLLIKRLDVIIYNANQNQQKTIFSILKNDYNSYKHQKAFLQFLKNFIKQNQRNQKLRILFYLQRRQQNQSQCCSSINDRTIMKKDEFQNLDTDFDTDFGFNRRNIQVGVPISQTQSQNIFANLSKIKDKSKILPYILHSLILQRLHIALLHIKFFKQQHNKPKTIHVKLGQLLKRPRKSLIERKEKNLFILERIKNKLRQKNDKIYLLSAMDPRSTQQSFVVKSLRNSHVKKQQQCKSNRITIGVHKHKDFRKSQRKPSLENSASRQQRKKLNKRFNHSHFNRAQVPIEVQSKIILQNLRQKFKLESQKQKIPQLELPRFMLNISNNEQRKTQKRISPRMD